jgi:hypothetical protein
MKECKKWRQFEVCDLFVELELSFETAGRLRCGNDSAMGFVMGQRTWDERAVPNGG